MRNMKKTYNYSRILSLIFIIGLAISIYFVYRGVETNLTYGFVRIFLSYSIVYALYMVIKMVLKIKGLSMKDIKSLAVSFLVYLLASGILSYGVMAFSSPENINLLTILSVAIGPAIALTCIKLIVLSTGAEIEEQKRAQEEELKNSGNTTKNKKKKKKKKK